jgi:LytS/YehU family sensor histidine kinase
MNWSFALVSTLPNWYIWAAMAPLIVKLARAYPLEASKWKSVILTVHLPALLASMIVHSMVNLLLFRTAGLHDTLDFGLYKVHFFSRVHANIFAYAAIVGLYHALDYYQKYVSSQKETASLQVQLAQANLRALKMQIHPHFLFNTLNSIAALVRKRENKDAVAMLAQLGDFFRIALENKGPQEIPLSQELDFLRRYLSIEKIRFGDRLTVNIEVPDQFKDLFVPNLILQPIVENAIHYGIAPSTRAGRIDIVISSRDQKLCISVRDNGPGVSNPEQLMKGAGVSSMQKRLENLYGNNQSYSVGNSSTGGLEVVICLPQSTEPVMTPPVESL